MTDNIFEPLTLPCGQVLPNRLCKAAMEENLAGPGQIPDEKLFNLYDAWAKGGAGLILSGNVMVDPRAMTGPGGIVLEQGRYLVDETKNAFERWAETGKAGGGKFVMQISHPGRQVYATMGTEAVSASATKVTLDGPADKMFSPARALSSDEIRGMIKRFADTAHMAERAGFDGVQIHAAHGYLVAQFLSPLTNQRDDEWGGQLENRARFLLEIIRAVRERVESDFIVAVKLNSADFQKGGFDVGDAKQVVKWLDGEEVDFVELSGGSYESAAMMGMAADGRAQSTKDREMFFLDFAKTIMTAATMPVMVTGGVTRKETAETALSEGVDIVGIARAMAYNPSLPNNWKAQTALQTHIGSANWKNKSLRSLANMALTKAQLNRMSQGLGVKAKQNAFMTLVAQQIKQAKQTKRYKAWLGAYLSK